MHKSPDRLTSLLGDFDGFLVLLGGRADRDRRPRTQFVVSDPPTG